MNRRTLQIGVMLTCFFGEMFALGTLATGAQAQERMSPSIIPAKGELHALMKQIEDEAKEQKPEVIFLGDSITDGWRRDGKDTWEQYYAKRNSLIAGVPGDRTEHVLWRLDQPAMKNLKPRLVVLLIGTNNLSANRSTDDTVLGVHTVVQRIRELYPESKLLVLGILPRGTGKGQPQPALAKDEPQCRQAFEINTKTAKLNNGKDIIYCDVGQRFLTANGALNLELMPDTLHPNSAGHVAMAEEIEPWVAWLLDETKTPPNR